IDERFINSGHIFSDFKF
ncbi:unnamed protein product, partial [Arctia plantaginis]